MNVCINYKCYIMIESTIECIVVNKISGSKESDICHYWYLLDKGFKFQPYVCNRCHDLLMMPINLNSITVLNINGTDVMPCHCSPGDLYQVLRIWDIFFYHRRFFILHSYTLNGISKSNTANLLQNTDLTKKRGIL